jgi:hypothetical protein
MDVFGDTLLPTTWDWDTVDVSGDIFQLMTAVLVAGGFFVAGTNLTENLGYVLVHPSGSLRTMTLPSLPDLSAWVREQCPGPGPRCTNIIAGDFIGADTFVSDVIRLNDKLLWC